jgi:hypothetical protein
MQSVRKLTMRNWMGVRVGILGSEYYFMFVVQYRKYTVIHICAYTLVFSTSRLHKRVF